MRPSFRSIVTVISSSLLALVLAACGAASPSASGLANGSTGGGATASVAITVSGPATVALGAQSQYSATVTGSSDATVKWSVNGVSGGDATVGAISASGLYAAPANTPGSGSVTITAASVADPATAQSLVVGLTTPAPSGPPVITVTLSGSTSVTLGTSSQYAATVTGSTNTDVAWSVNGVAGGNAAVGTISAAGLYKAPVSTSVASVDIAATWAADSSKSQSLAVSLVSPATPPGQAVSVSLSGAASVMLGNSSKYVATVTGSTNKGVIWSVNGMQGGGAAVGTISTSGQYKAPAKAPQPSTVKITATSAADTSKAQTMSVVLTTPPPAPSGQGVTLSLSGPGSVTLGSTGQYTAVVTNATNTSVTWRVDGVLGGTSSEGDISQAGLYTAPGTMPSPSTVTITATSVADPSISKSLVTTLAAPVAPPPPPSRIPANAISSGDLNASRAWQWNHDPGTPGSSQGSTVYPVPNLSPDNSSREFYMNYSGHGGEIYHVSFAHDTNATHFVYDAYVYIEDPSQLQNLEMDMNQVMADGRTVIFGFQCASGSGTWEYTLVANGSTHWHPSNVACKVKNWTGKTWHHIQIASHRDASGNVGYDWVNLDETYSNLQNATGNSAQSLGWAMGDLLINLQFDGSSASSGSITAYADKIIVYRW
ncbi:MAG: Ig domain protein group 2 domain protein [Acidobacteriaceae bacterium]|nr:Ig domain protein group 2 domain protein [Acidobacteriaceae bacterium]